MKIIYKPAQFNNAIQCKYCGCMFSFEGEDVETSYMTTEDGEVFNFQAQVSCPCCKVYNPVVFKKENNNENSSD